MERSRTLSGTVHANNLPTYSDRDIPPLNLVLRKRSRTSFLVKFEMFTFSPTGTVSFSLSNRILVLVKGNVSAFGPIKSLEERSGNRGCGVRNNTV